MDENKMKHTCGECDFLVVTDEFQYHDCREGSPTVVIPSFKRNEVSDSSSSKDKFDLVGKIMTVWPRVAKCETACGKFKPKEE
jgi:hypothetical protein